MKAANCVRYKKPYEFKKLQEEQSFFNKKVEDAVKEAEAALNNLNDSPALRVQEALKKDSWLLSQRQKLIKIAGPYGNSSTLLVVWYEGGVTRWTRG